MPVERAWLGGLLTLVDPAVLLRAARPVLTSEAVGERRTALRRLERAASYLGNPPMPLPAPGATSKELEGLAALLDSVLARPPTERYREKGRPRGEGSSGKAHTAVDAVEPHGAATRTAYARLDAPNRVAPATTFEVRVGLAETPTAEVLQDAPFTVPASAFVLSMHIVANGFRLLGGQRWQRELEVSAEDPFPYDVLRLVALDGFAAYRAIFVEYAVGDRVLGTAQRVVLVSESDDVSEPEPPATPGGAWVLQSDDAAARPDLEITVVPGNDQAGVAVSWLCRSRHAGVAGAPGPFHRKLPESAEWAKQVVRGIEDRRSEVDLGEYLAGLGAMVGNAVPTEVWDALHAVAQITKPAAPTVLLASWEPYVPWELAQVPRPVDAEAPPILGAQAAVGRWTYSENLRTAGPPPVLELDAMAVVTGNYQGKLSLPDAEQEGASLTGRYRCEVVDATKRPILDCLKGTPRADVLHFALHGKSDTTGTADGLLMTDRTYLDPISVRGVGRALGGAPSQIRLAFLNACQLGQGRRLLGEYSGMAAALLGLGVGAVVAPLWKVDDGVARTVAEAFYAAVFAADGISPAEQMRRERIATSGAEGSPAGTRLAYLYFGHPCLRVTWRGERGG
jgi:hypothetical protein